MRFFSDGGWSGSTSFQSGRRIPAVIRLALLGVLLVSAAPGSARSGTKIEAARVKAIAKTLSSKPAGLGRPITDRAAWEPLAKLPAFAGIVPAAERLSQSPVPALPDELYLDFSRTGNRDRCQQVLGERGNRLTTLALAECLENRGRFVAPLTDIISAVCTQRAWTLPAHDRSLDNFYGRTVEIDLRAAAIGWELATIDYLLGDTLPADSRRLIRENVKRRVLQPYRNMWEGKSRELWLHGSNNWNAVCHAGVIGSALAMEESPRDRAWFIAAAEQGLKSFLGGFTADGYCSEGLGYWNYGFGHYCALVEIVRPATGGKIDLLADPAALPPALFGARAEIMHDVYPTIADCSPGTRPDAKLMEYLNERLGLSPPEERQGEFVRPAGDMAFTALYTFLPERLPVAQRADRSGDGPLRTWFKAGGVLICRPKPESHTEFAVVIKGGNNAENHNHNDVGSFSVVLGNTMVLCDPGGEVYTARTFGPRRYESKMLNSFGHAVPVMAGKLQSSGPKAQAAVSRADFSDDVDTLALNIRSAYVVPELRKLKRTFVYHRAAPAALTVSDEFEFIEPNSFETALITWSPWKKISANELVVGEGKAAVRVKIDTGGRPFEVRSETINEDVHTRTKPVHLGIALEAPVKAATVTLTITPEATAP